jgi:hypothetical protein
MGVQIKTPNITAGNDRERLMQIQSYLYQMAQQLQWAFDTIQVSGGGGSQPVVQQTKATYISTAQDPKTTFAGIKDLIIKSADIVDAYYDTISSRLEGLYVAQSDFGAYVQETDLEIQGNAEGIRQLFSNEQIILSDAEILSTRVDGLTENAGTLSGKVDGLTAQNKELENSLNELYASSILTNAYIKTGLIDHKNDGTPVYGLEIGQTNRVNGESVFDKFARFTSDRLSFFDSNDVEVAYISDYKLYITNAEISGSLWLSGKFKIYYKGGLAFQWIGGDS